MNTLPDSASIVDLRHLLRERFPAAHARDTEAAPPPDHEPLGVACLDEIGVVRGTVTEVVSPRLSAGNALLLQGLLEGAARRNRHLALVDGRDTFDPQSASGEACAHLLWVRCRSAADAIKAADLLLRDGNLELVAMDLQLNPLRELGPIPGSSWHRLRSLVEKSGAMLIALTPQRLIASAHLRVELDSDFSLEAFDAPRETLHDELALRLLRQRLAVSG